MVFCIAAIGAEGRNASALAAGESKSSGPQIPILVYHRFGLVAADSMTVTNAVFESQLNYIKENGYTVVPLRSAVEYLKEKGPPLPSHSVVITADDGHRSVFTDMFPIIRKYSIPVTLFIYPSAISNATYAMTWEQLADLKATGLFTIESHTYWHPNFKIEKRRLSAPEYERFVRIQMVKARTTLEGKFGGTVDMLAWPFGIYDDELIGKARAAGYVAAFTIERRHATREDNIMALPRYLITDGDRGKIFARILSGESAVRKGDSRSPAAGSESLMRPEGDGR